ncbi:hypothetical protein N7522_012767 [Penicillium canescens]|nr:hypothetical protein N7522_012767 [Penicillium canescens]
MSNDDRGYIPQWGELPVEQYMIARFPYRLYCTRRSLTLRRDTGTSQRQSPPTNSASCLSGNLSIWTRYPANGILSTTAHHRHACPCGGDRHGPPSLAVGRTAPESMANIGIRQRRTDFSRSYYNPEDDEKMEERVDASEEFRNQAWWACLNDATLFNFGFDWQRVYDVMPEVAGPVSEAGYTRYPSPEIVEMSRTQFRTSLRKTKQSEPHRWREDPDRFIEFEAADLLRTVAAAYILVADQKAFETGGQVRLVYVDGKRNVIQKTRVEADAQTITDVIMDWDQLNLPPDLWEEGTIGDRYRVNRDLGRELYQLSEVDMADL